MNTSNPKNYSHNSYNQKTHTYEKKWRAYSNYGDKLFKSKLNDLGTNASIFTIILQILWIIISAIILLSLFIFILPLVLIVLAVGFAIVLWNRYKFSKMRKHHQSNYTNMHNSSADDISRQADNQVKDWVEIEVTAKDVTEATSEGKSGK